MLRRQTTRHVSVRPRGAGPIMPVMALAFVALVFATSGSADAFPTVSLVRVNGALAFKPLVIQVKDGGRVRVCNKTNVFSQLFSYHRDNRFGTPNGLRVVPGACVTIRLHNSGVKTARVGIFDELHSVPRFHAWVTPKGGAGGAAPPAPKPPEAGAFPGGTATTLTFTIAGKTVKTNLKTNKQTPADTIVKATSDQALDGKASLDGTLPKGWVVVVFHYGTTNDILVNSPTGGEVKGGFKAPYAGFDAFTRPGAYICKTKASTICAPAAQANISIDWDP
jgi:hypothetical protein